MIEVLDSFWLQGEKAAGFDIFAGCPWAGPRNLPWTPVIAREDYASTLAHV